MRIDYGENVSYEPEWMGRLARQRLVVDMAVTLLSGDGRITLVMPRGVAVTYDLHSGVVGVEENKVGDVFNRLPLLEDHIRQPIQAAIRLIAAFELLKRIAKLDNSRIAAIVKKHHPNLDEPRENMHMIYATLAAINKTRKQSFLAIFSLFSVANNIKNNVSIVDKAIDALIGGHIQNLADVEKVLPRHQREIPVHLAKR